MHPIKNWRKRVNFKHFEHKFSVLALDEGDRSSSQILPPPTAITVNKTLSPSPLLTLPHIVMTRLFKRDPEVAKLIYDVGVRHQTRNITEDEMTMLGKSIYSAVRDIIGPNSDKDLAAWQNLLDVVSYHFKQGLRGDPYEKEPLNQ